MFEGLGKEIIEVLEYFRQKDGWLLFWLFCGSSVIALIYSINNFIYKLIHAFIPEVVVHKYYTCSCHHEEGYQLASKDAD